LLPGGEWSARVVGALLIVLGLAVVARPELALVLHPSSSGM
jgi:uncharacterized membrane protein HdeD (DUF308 family)